MSITLSDTYLFKVHEDRILVFRKNGDVWEEKYFIIAGQCSCPAGQHGKKCKHIEMSLKKLTGDLLSVNQVNQFLRNYIPYVLPEGGHKYDMMLISMPVSFGGFLEVDIFDVDGLKFVVYKGV